MRRSEEGSIIYKTRKIGCYFIVIKIKEKRRCQLKNNISSYCRSSPSSFVKKQKIISDHSGIRVNTTLVSNNGAGEEQSIGSLQGAFTSTADGSEMSKLQCHERCRCNRSYWYKLTKKFRLA